VTLDRGSDLRAADWRFLLPSLPHGRALCLAAPGSPEPGVLAETCAEVTVRRPGERPPPGRFDLVAVLAGPVPAARALAEWVAPGGALYLSVRRPPLLAPPTRARARLRRAGFSHIVCYWAKPNPARPELLLPLDDRRLQWYYIDSLYFAISPTRRLLRLGLRGLIAAGLFEWALPHYCVVARRGDPHARQA
jgi:hypothetical protein